MLMVSFPRNSQIVFQSIYINLYSHQEFRRILFDPQNHQHLGLLALFILVILVIVKWYWFQSAFELIKLNTFPILVGHLNIFFCKVSFHLFCLLYLLCYLIFFLFIFGSFKIYILYMKFLMVSVLHYLCSFCGLSYHCLKNMIWWTLILNYNVIQCISFSLWLVLLDCVTVIKTFF